MPPSRTSSMGLPPPALWDRHALHGLRLTRLEGRGLTLDGVEEREVRLHVERLVPHDLVPIRAVGNLVAKRLQLGVGHRDPLDTVGRLQENRIRLERWDSRS